MLGQHHGMPDGQGQDAGAEFEPVRVGGRHRQGDERLQTPLAADNPIAEPRGVVAVRIPHRTSWRRSWGSCPSGARLPYISDGNTHRASFLSNVTRSAWGLTGMGQARAFLWNLVPVPDGPHQGAGASRGTMQPWGLGSVVLMMPNRPRAGNRTGLGARQASSWPPSPSSGLALSSARRLTHAAPRDG